MDIAPQTPNEEELFSIHARVLDSMTEGVSVTDENGFIQYTNAAEDHMFGYERGELIGSHVTQQNAYPPEENQRIVADVIRELQTSGAWQGEWLNRKKDGTPFYTRAKITALKISAKIYWVCVQEDITQRRKWEMELRGANETLHALVVASPLPIVAFTRDGLITLWNPAAERVFGWAESEVLGKPLPFIPEDKADEHLQMRERDLQGNGFSGREVRRKRKDGTPIDISVSTAAVHDASGQITGIMSVYLDITEQTKASEEQRQSLEMLRVIESQLMLLVGASGALLASPKSAHVLETILRLAQQFVAAEAYAVWRRRGDEWHLVLSTGLSDNYEQANRVAAAKWSGSLTAAPLVIEDVENSEIVRHRLSLYRAERIRSILAVPLQIHGESAGTIVFYYRSPHTFSDAERRVAGALGNLAAAALGTAELYEREAELRRVAEAAERRSSFLATVGETLASSLEYEATLASVAKLAVPFFADWCGVDIVDDYGTVRRLAVQHVDPAKIEFAYEFMRRYPPREDDPTRVALRTGQSILMPEIPEALLIESATNAQHLELMRTIGLKSVICAPMQARGRVLGVITFVTSDSGRRYGSSDLALAEEIASRAAVAVENARLFKEVRESEERFRRLYDSNMVGIAFWHSDSYLTAANDAYLHQMGITREEFEVSDNVSWVPFTPDEYRAVDDQIIRECREHGASGIYEKEYAHRDGTRVTVLIAAAFLSSSQHQGVAFALDITDRKKLERQFRGVADAAVSINGARSVEDVLRVVAEQARVLIGARESSASLSAENSSVEAGTLSVPLKNRSGQNIGAVRLSNGPSADFSESDRAIVIQLAEMASIAIQNVTLNEFLLRSNEELRRANEDLNQFAYSASHDLQEPLRMIAIYTQLLSRKCGAQFDSEAHTFMRYTLEGAQRMEMLLRDLLAYTHAINIRGFPQGPVDSAKALQEALANLQTAIAAAGAEIRIGTMPSVRAFEAHLVQLFQNLLGNAIKYRSSAPPVIEVNATQDSDRGMWLFSVRDNGIGINPKYHQQVFGLFKRLYPSNEYPGTGIGLAICQRVVERYGGAIWVESEQGRGSTFHFTLPA